MPSAHVQRLLDDLHEYLVHHEYADSTTTAYVSVAKRVLTYLDTEGSAPTATSKGRAGIRALLKATSPADLGEFHTPLLGYLEIDKDRTPLQRRKARERTRRREARSYSEENWRALWSALQDERTPEAAVLLVLMATGLRIASVLAITRDQLREALETGELRLVTKGDRERMLMIVGVTPWALLYKRFVDAGTLGNPDNVALLVSPGGDGSPEAGDAAYRRVYRYLKTIHKVLKLHGNAHPHRLRRSMAVHALRETEDVVAVQQLLGHASIHSTMRYLDEARPGKVSEIQQRTLRRLRGMTEEPPEPGEDE